MYRENCIEFLKNSTERYRGEETFYFVRDVNNSIIKSIRSAQSFYLGESQYALDAVKYKTQPIGYEDLLGLPFDLCWISAKTNKAIMDERFDFKQEAMAILALKRKDFVNLIFFYKSPYRAFSKQIANHYKHLLRSDGWVMQSGVRVFRKEWGAMSSTAKFKHFNYQGFDPVLEIGHEIATLTSFLKLLSCKNIVTQKNNPPEKLNKKRIKSGNEPLFTYHTLKVLLPGRRIMSPPVGQAGRTVKLHLCRGHFKEYTPERPLFGKYTGRYWWQPIARGDKREGVVMKNYQVEYEGASQ